MENGRLSDLGKVPYKKWWKKRSKPEKYLIVATIISAVLLVIVLLIYLLTPNDPGVCTSSTCVRTSMELLNYMDIKVDPCEDFYRFACGNFLLNTNLDNRGSRSVQNIMAEEIQAQIRNMLEQPIDSEGPIGFNLAKKFYRACMNESAIEAEGLKRMKQIFRQIGGWPTLIGNNWRESQFDWKDALYKLRKIGINFEFFLILSVQNDKANPTRHILTLKDPSYSPSKISAEVQAMYLDYMVDIAVLFGAQRERARREQYEVMQFLLSLAQISEKAKTTNGSDLYNPMSISELEHEFTDVPWFEYINNILNPAPGITYDDIVSVSDPTYLRKMLDIIKNTKKRILANFISWHTLQHLINYLPTQVQNRAHNYLEKVNGQYTKEPRWNVCVTSTQQRFETTISSAYIEKHFNNDMRRRVISMIQKTKHQFKENLHKLEWLDERAKSMAIEKLITSVEDIASPTNPNEHHEHYDKVEISEENLLTSILNLDYVNTNIEYGKLREPVMDNLLKHEGFVTGLNIVFRPKENILKIPVGVFQGIYYQKDRPEYMNYGALGSIIAHEISHIIIEAEYRDLQGELRSWWSTHSLLDYEEKLQCISNHYSQFSLPMSKQRLNTTNTRDEDMADLAGMKVSYDTYINWVQENGAEPRLPGLNYSPNQLFWISSAIHHCTKYSTQTLQRYIANYRRSPEQFRVNGVLQNIHEFAYDFACPTGSYMNPEHKCNVW